jgi:hypothetical protein
MAGVVVGIVVVILVMAVIAFVIASRWRHRYAGADAATQSRMRRQRNRFIATSGTWFSRGNSLRRGDDGGSSGEPDPPCPESFELHRDSPEV